MTDSLTFKSFNCEVFLSKFSWSTRDTQFYLPIILALCDKTQRRLRSEAFLLFPHFSPLVFLCNVLIFRVQAKSCFSHKSYLLCKCLNSYKCVSKIPHIRRHQQTTVRMVKAHAHEDYGNKSRHWFTWLKDVALSIVISLKSSKR